MSGHSGAVRSASSRACISELPSWRSTPRARPQAEASRGLIPWLPFALWTPWMAPVGLSLAGYIMHNLRI